MNTTPHTPIASELTVTEAELSRAKAAKELQAPDPRPAVAKAILAANEERDDDA